jgi:hypothetical protein
MIVITGKEFGDNPQKYIDLATKERIIIKKEQEYLEIVPRGKSIPENPSPSNDPYFDDPENIERILHSSTQIAEGKVHTLERKDIRSFLGLD